MQLQQTYEIILGEALDKRNFRRRILDAGGIEATAYKHSDGGRPARLYRYRDDAVAEAKTRRLFPWQYQEIKQKRRLVLELVSILNQLS